MARTRLNSVDPDLDSALTRASVEKQRAAACAAVAWALQSIRVSHPAIDTAIATGQVNSVASLVVELDAKYFKLQETNEAGECSIDVVLQAFAVARSVSAAEFLVRGDYFEAIYESGSAVDDWPTLRLVIQSCLT